MISFLSVTVPSPTAEIFVFGDLHYGTPEQDRRKILQGIKYIHETPNCYGVSIGDNLDLATASSYGIIGVTPSPQLAVEELGADFRGLVETGKMLGFIEGNHDQRLLKATRSKIDLTETLINEWNNIYGTNVQYGKPAMLIQMKVQRDNAAGHDSFLCCFHHGTGGGGMPGSAINASHKLKNIVVDADAYIQGHHHNPSSQQNTLPTFNSNGTVGFKEQVFLTTGGHTVNAEYAQEKLLAPRPNKDILLKFAGRAHSGVKKSLKFDFV